MSTGTESGSQALNLEKCSVVLLDVAGTTTSINFVKDTLFKYVTKQADEFLKAQWENETVKEAIKDLKDAELDLIGATAAVKELTEQNSENKGLKTIQGLIYKKGYEDGDLKAHVFSDVPSCLEAWAKSRKVAIYSTGSVESQQLLFGHTSEGDVSSHITKYFDQSVGGKMESESYEKIAKELEVKTEEIVFVTDNTKEAEAAKTAGIMSVLVRREGNEEIPEDSAKAFHVVSSFKEIVFENPGKRKNKEETVPTEEQPPSKLAKTDNVEDKAAAAEVPAKDAPQQEEKMEVDAPTESEAEANAEKPDDKPSAPTTEKDKTEMDSTDDKTEPTSTTEQTEPEKVEETPMDTEKVATNDKADKPDETDEKKEETATVKEASEEEKTKVAEVTSEAKEKSVEKKDQSDDQIEKMEAEETSEPPSNKDSNNEASTNETVKAAKEEEKIDGKETNKVDAKEEETKDSATSNTNEVEMKEESTKGQIDEKVAEQKTEEKKIDTAKEKAEEKVVSSSEDAKEEAPKTTEVSDKVEEKAEKTEEASVKAEAESNGSEAKAESAESSTSKAESAESSTSKAESAESSTSKAEEKADSSEACPKEEKAEASTSEAETSKDEKENKSELANGVENGEAEKTEAVNGDAEEKRNGDAKSEEADSKVDDIKVKKIEETPDSTPAVSVEV